MSIGGIDRVLDMRSVVSVRYLDTIPAAWPDISVFSLGAHMTMIAINPSRHSDSGNPSVFKSSPPPRKQIHHNPRCDLSSAEPGASLHVCWVLDPSVRVSSYDVVIIWERVKVYTCRGFLEVIGGVISNWDH